MFSFFRTTRTATAQTAPLFLFNTMAGRKEVFALRDARKPVTLYTCGPTVYDYAHIGNFRSFVFADLLKRTLVYNGYAVSHTMNFTDFGHLVGDGDEGEDKMLVALRRAELEPSRENMRAIATTFIEAYEEDARALHLEPPTQYTRASDYIREQITLIRTLVEKGYTYETSDGIYFDTERFPDYGKLGGINLAGGREGTRIAPNPEKHHPADFVLWKKGELGWDSPWGAGFPGWHIECTAMAFATLGKQIDIHTGGIDHIPTHHNGEIAQAEAATGKTPYVRYWLHNAFITIDAKRIGKSEGNAITLRQLKDRGFPALAYRYWLLTGHYRSPMNFTFEALSGAKQALFRLKRAALEELEGDGAIIPEYEQRFHEAINDDLDTPKAVALVWELLKSEHPAGDKAATLKHFDTVLGLGIFDTADPAMRALGVLSMADLPEDVASLITEREQVRAKKDWDEADALREAINLKGYLVEDTPQGPKVTKA